MYIYSENDCIFFFYLVIYKFSSKLKYSIIIRYNIIILFTVQTKRNSTVVSSRQADLLCEFRKQQFVLCK